MTDTTLECKKCGEEKSDIEFSPNRRNVGRRGRGTYCRGCKRVRDRSDYYRRLQETDLVAFRSRQADARLRTRYGLSRVEFDAMVIAQAHCCLLCERRVAKLCVDHDHVTGQVRGLLCNICNLGLGTVEKHGWLTRAFDYLGLV